MWWIYATFEPVAIFGLRPSNTTSSGGKSLVCPTPYAIKMAVLDRLIREQGIAAGVERFPQIRDLTIWLHGADVVTVTRTFQKVLRPQKTVENPSTRRMDVWTSTIAQRELVLMSGQMILALGTAGTDLADELRQLLGSINYFGRRGSFMQLTAASVREQPPTSGEGFVNLGQPIMPDALGFGYLQRMDDMRPDAEWVDVDVVNGSTRGDGGRISYTVVLPYQLHRHAVIHTVYALPEVHVR